MDEKILIVSASEKSGSALAGILKRYTWNNISIVTSGAETRRAAMRGLFDLIVINSPLKDEQGMGLAADLINNTHSSVILIAKNEQYDIIASKVEGDGVFVLPKPLQQRQFLGAVRLAIGTCARLRKADAAIAKHEKKYEELRMVSRAKCFLIEHEKMTEPEAHRYIEKQAMDKRENRGTVAAGIIKRYM